MKKITSLILALVMALSLTTAAFADDHTTTGTTGSVTITTATGEPTTNKVGDRWIINVPASTDKVALDPKNVADVYYVVVTWEVKSDIVYQIGGKGYSWKLYSEDALAGSEVTADSTGTPSSAGYVSNGNKWDKTATVKLTVENWSNVALTAASSFRGATTADDNANVKSDIEVAATGTGALESAGETGKIASAAAGIDTSSATLYTNNAVTATQTITVGTPTGGEISGNTNIGFVTLTINKAA